MTNNITVPRIWTQHCAKICSAWWTRWLLIYDIDDQESLFN
jgi:hypothetical protein